MSELLKSFVDESRGLIESASETLLALETDPQNADKLNDLFRSVHTIKGGAGLFAPPGMVPTLHAAEDLLDTIRDGNLTLTADLTDLLLNVLDQVVSWLDQLEVDGTLPEEAAAVGAALAAELQRFNPNTGDDGAEVAASVDAPLPDWFADARKDMAPTGAETLYAIDYVPDPQCFFTGHDPLQTALSLPERRWLNVAPVNPWASAEEFDPYLCYVSIRMASAAPRDALDEHLSYVIEDCRVSAVPASDTSASTSASTGTTTTKAPSNTQLAIEFVECQRHALSVQSDPALWEGRVAASCAVLTSIFEQTGLDALIPDLDEKRPEAIENGDVSPLEPVLTAALAALREEKSPQTAVAESYASPSQQPSHPAPTPASAQRETGDTNRSRMAIKVEQEQVDSLMKLVGEIIVAKNALPFLVKRAEEVYANRRMARELKSEYEAINRIVDEMQAAVMQIRMVPISQVFQRYHRLVRDVARKLDKRINLKLEGEDTKADKNIVEDLADPLVHLIRNACDHGLEMPDTRVAAGKPETGTITLAARQQDDQVVVEVLDDGGGSKLEKVRAKAIANGMATKEAVAAMSDDEAAQLIIQPGFSTADEISDLSGRGVGMDVVNSMVKRSGGSMRLTTKPGEGTTVAISLPLSMAVSQVMMFDVDGGLYGISIENIVETVRLPESSVHRLKHHAQVVLRGRLIPLRRLSVMFDPTKADDPWPKELSILVVRNGAQEIGLVVDGVRSEADVMVEPLDRQLNSSGYFSGTSLLGDGSIMLVLNVREML